MLDVGTACQEIQFTPVTTCLSPYVHELVIHHTYSNKRDDRVLDEDGNINFDYVCSKLPSM